MKAADVIKAYKNGERNFQRLNLRGANFKEQDLSGADFSYCQLQSANFSQANLTNTKFIGVKAGLQKRWLILFLLVVLVLIIISSLFSALLGSIVSLIFESNLENKVSGWTGLITIIIFFIISFRKNLGGGNIFSRSRSRSRSLRLRLRRSVNPICLLSGLSYPQRRNERSLVTKDCDCFCCYGWYIFL